MHTLDTLVTLRDTAVEVAISAAALIEETDRQVRPHLAASVQTKTSAVDPVTVVDKAAEAHIATALHTLRPDDGLLGEEGARHTGTTGIDWVVDPIDGTVNFLYNIPRYAVSIAAVDEGTPVAGAVINVATGDIYRAYAGGPAERATAAGEWIPISASACRDITATLVATGFSYESERRVKQARIFSGMIPTVRDIRRLGAAALDLCSLAEGSVDAYYEHGLHAWDWAAGVVIARAAGAHILTPPIDVPGGGGQPLIAAAPGVWDDFVDLVERAGGLAHQ
ncbi:MAG: inositol monophosphatase family protein [Corynebacterium sp.]|nr:inositol monophosphatase family protein [Corynebacterium sp.]